MKKDRSNDLSLALFCAVAHGINPDLIENSKVLRSLIDYQFEKTFKVFNIQFIVYVILYFMPNLILFTNNDLTRG